MRPRIMQMVAGGLGSFRSKQVQHAYLSKTKYFRGLVLQVLIKLSGVLQIGECTLASNHRIRARRS